MPRRCAACHADIPDAHRFCGSCGTPAPSASQIPTVTAATVVPVAVASPDTPLAARILSGDSAGGGFTPGTLLAGRYRIIGLLGRGGMGEVYRADDLKLGQAVALKFLPRAFAADATRLERFLAEVRVARQVSHPNVCRVYDIADIDGRHFLSMEYVDGEDLKQLLHRIGRLPSDKALDISRQIAAGLSAAHEHGVLHRDLKPANVMLDGRGRVRIMDFGLAVAADAAGLADAAGTPAYMAPEQFAGKPASVKSDIYAFGLVMYELYTGRRAFDDSSLAALLAGKEEGTAAPPSTVITDMDPAVESVIMRAIDRRPAARPASVVQLSAMLPGGNPLQAAIRAGETPSPEMVAASGTTEGLEPRHAWALVALTIAGAIVAAMLASKSHLWQHAVFDKSPQVLAERARHIRTALGYGADPVDVASGYEADVDHLRYLRLREPSRARWSRAAPSFFRFWYRESPAPLESWRFAFRYANRSRVDAIDPPLDRAGMALVRLDPTGRLTQFVAVPPAVDAHAGANGSVTLDWPATIAAAGFDIAPWQATEPQWTPPVYADRRAAWHGTWPNRPDLTVRFEAAALRGKLVYFEAVFPWTPTPRTTSGMLTAGERAALVPMFLTAAALLIAATVFASRNLHAGRGDRRGAFRLAAFVFTTIVVAWFFGEQHVAGVGEVTLVVMGFSWALLVAAVCWLAYLAVEPFVRRRWPQLLVSWTRVLAGNIRDPLVGRHVLIGCAGGTVLGSLSFLSGLVATWFGLPATLYPADVIGLAYDIRSIVPMLVSRAPQSVIVSLASLFGVLLLRLILKSQRKAMAAYVVITAAVIALPFEHYWISFLAAAVFGTVLVLMLRIGLLVAVTASYVNGLFILFPMTIDLQAWYAGASVTAMLVLAVLTLFGFIAALGDRPMFGRAAADSR